MIRRPPRSTLFPSRRSSDLLQTRCRLPGGAVSRTRRRRREARVNAARPRSSPQVAQLPRWARRWDAYSQVAWRSEEHTSELQSRLHLVCRLLLEKKKIKNEK